MGVRFAAARAVSSVSTWGLKHVFRRPAANFPGKVALYVDPCLIAHLAPRLRKGSVCVVGTNGKTTVTNLLADVLEASGSQVVCNRTGANLDSGVATSLLQAKAADWGIFECDELWLAKVLPHLQANYVLLLNLFRDQLDRVGEIDRIQDSIVGALGASPHTVLVYNADDPLCAMIAERAAALPGREGTRSVPFGVAGDMGLSQNTVADATMCQRCSSMFEYAYRQYGQLGEYRCPNCGFARPALAYAATGVQTGAAGLSFWLEAPAPSGAVPAAADAAAANAATPGRGADAATANAAAPGRGAVPDGAVPDGAVPGGAVPGGAGGALAGCPAGGAGCAVRAPFSGAYMVYNLMVVAVAADLLGCSPSAVQQAIDAFDPQNGRLQAFEIGGRRTLLNLAKNPTGFNQNLKIVTADGGPAAVAFFINDKEADGHDVSWLWDIDFEELSACRDTIVFAGGIRARDMQVRLKYAGITAEVVEGAADMFGRIAGLPSSVPAYLIANYTALPAVKADLERLAQGAGPASAGGGLPVAPAPADHAAPAPGSAGSPAAQDGVAASGEIPKPARAAAQGAGQKKASAAVQAAAQGEVSASAQGDPPVVIAHLFPDLLNLYGDGGNVRILEQRLRWRGIPVQVRHVHHGEEIDLAHVDLVFLGGGPDREQKLASESLVRMADGLRAFVEDDGVLLAICGGYQILGSKWLLGNDEIPGLGIVDIETRRAGSSADRLIDNIVLRSPVAPCPVVGYENHAGRTYLGSGVEPFGSVVSSVGSGNNEADRQDGVRYRNVLGTYLHGPLLAKNPQVADDLLARALARRARRCGVAACKLAPLDDAAELAANEALCKRFGA